MSNKTIVKGIRSNLKRNETKNFIKLISNNVHLLNEEVLFGTWLHEAAIFGNYEAVRFLVENGIDVNKVCGTASYRAINDAARKGYYNIVKYLIENGSIIDTSTARLNPLFSAVHSGDVNVVKLLVEAGIDISAKYHIGSIEECDAVEYARQYGQTEIKEYLMEELSKKS